MATTPKLPKPLPERRATRRDAFDGKLIFTVADPNVKHHPPKRHYSGDAGFDLTVSRTVTVMERSFAQVPSNIRIAFPPGVWGMITGRSSTFFKRNLLVNTAIIDNGWRGELWAMVYNPTEKPVHVMPGERLIQVILFNLVLPEIIEVDPKEFPKGERGEKGFGSTGGHPDGED